MLDHEIHAADGVHSHQNCRELLGQMSDYVDGTADAALCAEIERHLDGCDSCRVVVDTLGKTVSLYQMLPDQDVPDEVHDRLLRVLHI